MWKSIVQLGSKYKKGYTYTATKEFSTKAEAMKAVKESIAHDKAQPHGKHLKFRGKVIKSKSKAKPKKGMFDPPWY